MRDKGRERKCDERESWKENKKRESGMRQKNGRENVLREKIGWARMKKRVNGMIENRRKKKWEEGESWSERENIKRESGMRMNEERENRLGRSQREKAAWEIMEERENEIREKIVEIE